MSRRNITLALFDVRPIDPESGRTDFNLINSLTSVVDLIRLQSKRKISPVQVSEYSALEVKTGPGFYGNSKEEILQELETTLSQTVDLNKELEMVGGRFVAPQTKLPQVSKSSFELDSLVRDSSGGLDNFRREFARIIPGLPVSKEKTGTKFLEPPPYLPWAKETSFQNGAVLALSPAAKEIDTILENLRKNYPVAAILDSIQPTIQPTAFRTILSEKNSKILLYFSLGIAASFVFTLLTLKTLNLKDSILQNGSQAFLNINSAQESLSGLRFFEAASSFALTTDNFKLLQEDFGKISNLLDVLNTLSLGKLSDASNLAKAGELISQAGHDLSDALLKLSGANLIALIQGSRDGPDIMKILQEFKLALIQANRNLSKVSDLISKTEIDLIPLNERQKFVEFKEKLPEFNKFVEKAIEYSDTLMIALGQSSPQRYIVLFQNTSELRPTGGFPGSFAILDFDRGFMENFVVDDIYNPDGQMKEKIIPPRPLQKVSLNWGMRDANWFSDFPTSAKKIAEFYYKDTRNLVDGVIAVNVDLVPKILEIVGPIEMAEYGVTLNSQNFLTEVQEEVEYIKTKGQSKQILVDFAPELLEKLSALNKDDWGKIFAVLVEGMEKKNILTYFTDGRLQKFALENGFAGQIKETDSDYLMVVHSNIMGSKTDAVIDNSVSLDVEADEEGNLIHTLGITRLHKGGDFGFYRRKNNDYLRVLVPLDAELIEINGNDQFDFGTTLDLRKEGFVSDPDLERYESRTKKVAGIEVLEEGGKKVFAFWLSIEPGEKSTVTLKYKTPVGDENHYELLVQKQPGLKSKFSLSVDGEAEEIIDLESDKTFRF